ncbi:hypothetical protein J31TS4_46230 [Paenibacillus sp. J31TS4]|uniref:FtsB family cell division protein n=1 Tax=Paenibacillus sp. J31TS4 TaxID=2807195 RepID=UPI001B077088|nr:septum formation initiator family protein [Paenibacillus sp. J31TS4]GIP41343.1 hypothetical protein J31TS4_46230 [Paenibacillus sp. J31TS4]
MEPSKNRTTNPTMKRKKRTLKLVLAAVAFISISAGVTIFDQVGKYKEKAAQLQELEAKLADVRKSNEEAKKELARLNDPEYREEIARRDLQVAKEGETVFQVPGAKR